MVHEQGTPLSPGHPWWGDRALWAVPPFLARWQRRDSVPFVPLPAWSWDVRRERPHPGKILFPWPDRRELADLVPGMEHRTCGFPSFPPLPPAQPLPGRDFGHTELTLSSVPWVGQPGGVRWPEGPQGTGASLFPGSFEGFVAARKDLAVVRLRSSGCSFRDHQRAQGRGCGHLLISKDISKANIEKYLGGGSRAGVLECWEPAAAAREKCWMYSRGWHMKGGARSDDLTV